MIELSFIPWCPLCQAAQSLWCYLCHSSHTLRLGCLAQKNMMHYQRLWMGFPSIFWKSGTLLLIHPLCLKIECNSLSKYVIIVKASVFNFGKNNKLTEWIVVNKDDRALRKWSCEANTGCFFADFSYILCTQAMFFCINTPFKVVSENVSAL